MDDNLQAALNAMYQNLLSRRKSQDHRPDGEVKRVVDCCHNFFLNMRTAYLKYHTIDDSCSQNDVLQALSNARFDITLAEQEQEGLGELGREIQPILTEQDIISGINKVFPDFSYEPYPLENILSTTEPSVVKILPYLLSSYYLNRHKNRKWFSSIEKYFTSNPKYFAEKTEAHFSRDVSNFLNIFSCERFLQNLAKKKRQPIDLKDRADEKDIKKVTEVYTNFLEKGPMTRFHYIQLYKAFVYFVCAAICANEITLEISEKIDYKKSWELFDSHTLAFRTIYCSEKPWKEFDEANDDIPAWIGDTIFSCCENEIRHEFYKDCTAHLKAHEIYLTADNYRDDGLPPPRLFYQPSETIEVKCTEQNLYINQAVVCSAIGNPLIHPHLCEPEKLISNLLHCDKISDGVKTYQMPYL